MELTEIAKAVSMYNMLYQAAPISEEQASHFLQIWGMVHGTPPNEPPSTAPVIETSPELPEKQNVVPLPPPNTSTQQEKFSELIAKEGDYIPAASGRPTYSKPGWLKGHPYRIALTVSKENRGLYEPRYVYFESKPTQDEFDEEYENYLKGTHHVHVHHRVWSQDWNNWENITITDEYCSWRHVGHGCFGEEYDTNPEWTQPLARYRIKFKNMGSLGKTDFRYVYFLNRPRDEKIQEYERRQKAVILELRDHIIGVPQ